MSFASAFLGEHGDASVEEQISESVEVILQAIAPEYDVPASFRETRASNLCFGVPMQWALGDGIESKQVRSVLRERLNKFEPRFITLQGIDITEDKENNFVTFYLVGVAQSGKDRETVDIEKKLSRLDLNAPGNS